MDGQSKKDYIEMINELGSELPLSNSLVKFIETYDGTNIEETELMIATALAAIATYEQARIKAETGYDKIMEAKGDFDEWFSGLKNEYTMLEKGEIPMQPTDDVEAVDTSTEQPTP